MATESAARSGCGDRAHERFVGIADVRIDHVEVPLVHRARRPARRPCRRNGGWPAPGRRASRSCGNPRSCRSGGPCRGRARRAGRRPGAKTVALPPISTLRSGIARVLGEGRAARSSGASGSRPRGKCTRVALHIGAGIAPELAAPPSSSRNSMPISSRMRSAFASMSARPLLVEDLEGRQLAADDGQGGRPSPPAAAHGAHPCRRRLRRLAVLAPRRLDRCPITVIIVLAAATIAACRHNPIRPPERPRAPVNGRG